MAAKLEELGFAVSRKAENKLAVRMVNSGIDTTGQQNQLANSVFNAARQLDQLATLMINGDFIIENHTMDDLTAQIMENGFTVWSDYRKDDFRQVVETAGFVVIDQIGGRSIIKRVNAQESEMINLKETIDLWREKAKKKFILLNGNIDQLLEEWSGNGFTIEADPAVREHWKKRLTGQKLQDCATTEAEGRLLPAKLSKGAKFGDIKIVNLLSNLKKSGFITIDLDIEELVRLAKQGITVVKSTNEITADMSENGFITWGGTAPTQLRTILEDEHYTVIEDHQSQLTVKGRSNHTLELRRRLADKLAKGGFPIVNKKNHSLVLKLSERAVINAVIQFALSHGQLDEKFAILIRLVSGRSGLGHLTEHYLAVQLRQYLSTRWADHSAGPENEWLSKRNFVLNALGKAKSRQGDTFERTIGSLDQYSLISGRQTIRKTNTWRDWVDTFLDWLAAIEEGRTPDASFLFPHNDFGPDIIFALSKTHHANHVIVCSIQLKTGGISSDAVNKSSVSWACNSARTKWKEDVEKQKESLETAKQELDEKSKDWNMKTKIVDVFQKLVKDKLSYMGKELGTKGEVVINTTSLQELERAYMRNFWEHQPKLSMLIATDACSDLDNARPVTLSKDQDAEYFAYIAGKDVEALFGRAFTTLLTTI